MAHHGQAQGHQDSFLLSGSHLQLLEGTAALYVDRDDRSFISLPKAAHPRNICGVNVKSYDRHSEKDAKNLGGLHFRSAPRLAPRGRENWCLLLRPLQEEGSMARRTWRDASTNLLYFFPVSLYTYIYTVVSLHVRPDINILYNLISTCLLLIHENFLTLLKILLKHLNASFKHSNIPKNLDHLFFFHYHK